MADRPPDIEHARQIAAERLERARRMHPIERILESVRLFDLCQKLTPDETLAKRRRQHADTPGSSERAHE